MMNHKTIVSFSLCFALGSCSTITELKLQSKSGFKDTGVKTIPFRYVKQLIVVDAKINNAETVNSFIFDTGAFQSKVAYNLAEELMLETISKRSNGTAQGIEQSIEITNIDSISIANATFYNIGTGKLKYDPKSFSPCVAKHGIIGANLIKLAHWRIDYESKEMKVSKVPFDLKSKNESYQLGFSTSFLSGIPKVNIEIEGQTIKDVIFDLGYNGGLTIPHKYAKKFSLANTQTLIDQSTTGIFGSNRDTLSVKQLHIKIGGFKTKIPVEFSTLNKALLGNDVLEHFTIQFNYHKETIILIPKSKVIVDQPRIFIPGIINDSLWMVSRTSQKIPLNIGDTLKTINGYRPKEVFSSHCDYFLNNTYHLKTDTLKIETIDGKKITIISNQQ